MFLIWQLYFGKQIWLIEMTTEKYQDCNWYRIYNYLFFAEFIIIRHGTLIIFCINLKKCTFTDVKVVSFHNKPEETVYIKLQCNATLARY